ncbi:MAG TPA: macro domain-containing protein [Candidatus Olsenella excrementavium]|uniref:Macro domain-containing protein n=1 Tax=Candidatus Olsenella excrementavium TaxID=2838709 RepID=A0A9D1ZBM5_9ACTN|nr:macro domain-containing protein [Candidatus Olsenella excrementavium]
MPFSIVRNDIARVRADVLVNAANERLAAGGGVCGAIFAGAGASRMTAACAQIGHCPTGSAVTTPGFDLPCRWVIHAVGPIWRGGTHGERELLRSCYRSVFAEVTRLGATSVAFPLISAGIFGYPVREALDVARAEASAFLDDHPDVEVTLVVFTRDVVAQGVALLGELREYVDDAYVDNSPHLYDRSAELRELCVPEAWPLAAEPPAPAPAAGGSVPPDELAERLAHLDAPFSEALLALIDERGLTDAQVYRRANLSRQLFSKIRSKPDYRPSKPTAVALALALGLTLPQTQELLAHAGLTLSRSSKFDVIVEFYLARGVHDVMTVNEALFAFDQPLLGSQ